jgi:hypothetical protein
LKRIEICSVLFITVVLIEGAMAPSLSQNSPSYVVELSIPNRTIDSLSESRVNLTFTISGFVDFLNGSVRVHSDTTNILVNTFYLRGYYVGTNGVTYQWLDEYPRSGSDEKAATTHYSFRGINCEWIDYDVCERYSTYTSAVKIVGNLMLDSFATNPGSHQVEVDFVVHIVTGDYRFSNSISYEVVGFWQTYYWIPVTMLVAILILTVAFVRFRRSHQ